MGSTIIKVCGNTDLFQHLIQKYGQKFIQLILSQKALQFLKTKFIQIIKQIKQYINSFIKQINQIVDEKIKQLNQKFQYFKSQINQLFPGGIAFIQEKQGSTIQQFSGFNQFVEQIDSIRDQTLLKIQEQRNQVQKQLLQQRDTLYKQIQAQRPKVPLYDQLSQEMRYKILDKGQRQFAEQIKKSQQDLNAKCDQKLNEQQSSLDSYLNKVNPQNILSDIVQKSGDKMMNKLSGGKIGEQLCGCFGCIF